MRIRIESNQSATSDGVVFISLSGLAESKARQVMDAIKQAYLREGYNVCDHRDHGNTRHCAWQDCKAETATGRSKYCPEHQAMAIEKNRNRWRS